jgi:hypothetical protein
MVFRTWCKHCHCLYPFLSFEFSHLHTCTLIRFSFISFYYVSYATSVDHRDVFGLLATIATTDYHPGGRMCIWFVSQAWPSVPMSSWPIVIKIVSHLHGLRGKELFPSRFENVFRDVQWKRSSYSDAPSNIFPTHQGSSILKTCTRRYGRNIKRCTFWKLHIASLE